jgi:magnesium transporter
MATGLMNTYLSSIANRTNEVMKVLTIMASVFIPLTFMAGIYGMNFDHMPELHVWWAYPLIWLTMLLVGLGMMAFFWKKGWIGTPQSNIETALIQDADSSESNAR